MHRADQVCTRAARCSVVAPHVAPLPTVQVAELLDANNLLCSLPPQSTAGVVEVRVSLNNATNGTLTRELNFTVYAPPVVSAITPTVGPAAGGTEITVLGSGFTALQGSTAGASAMRVRFGAVSLPTVPHFFDDGVILLNTTWGSSSSVGGEVVSVALNGEDFVGDTGVRFTFTGMHPPVLVDVYFNPSATELVMQFDSQPTNRGQQNGLAPCSFVLMDDTEAVLRGGMETEPLCDWRDDSTYVAFLGHLTNASAGMMVHVRPGVLWPRGWEPPSGGCGSSNLRWLRLCNQEAVVAVDPFFPCDRRLTPGRDECLRPSAVVQGPRLLPNCSSASISLSASASTGGGAKSLTFYHTSYPTQSDNHYRVQAVLNALGSEPEIELGAQHVAGGSTFRLVSIATNFLGITSDISITQVDRAEGPIPVAFISAPAYFELHPLRSLRLPAWASFADCYPGEVQDVFFTWNVTALPSGPGEEWNLNAPSTTAANSASNAWIDLHGVDLHTGVVYSVDVRACMVDAPDLCGSTSIHVAKGFAPMQTAIWPGDRSIGSTTSLTLSACVSSVDPADASARCALVGTSYVCGALSFNWTCTYSQNLSCPMQPPPPTSCSWDVDSGQMRHDGLSLGEMSAGSLEYVFRLAVVNTASNSGAVATAMRTVRRFNHPMLDVVIARRRAAKENAGARLKLEGSSLLPGVPPGDRTHLADVTYMWEMEDTHTQPITTDLANLTATGKTRPTLVVLPHMPHMLRAGALYTFTLRATYQGKTSYSSVQLLMK